MRATAATHGRPTTASATSTAALDGAATPSAVAAEPEVVKQPVRVDKTPGRNEPCPCGSGKKFKLCHGR